MIDDNHVVTDISIEVVSRPSHLGQNDRLVWNRVKCHLDIKLSKWWCWSHLILNKLDNWLTE